MAYLTDLFRRRLALAQPEDAAKAFMLLIVDGAFQARVWHDADETEIDRQVIYRTRLFASGLRHS
jgi:hypothetical protein